MVEKYQQHIQKLSDHLKCKVFQKSEYRNPIYGMMYTEFGYVECPIIENQRDYLVNLHELGHFAHSHHQGRPPFQDKKFYFDNGVLKSEAQAWEWALDHCLDQISEDNRLFIWEDCLGSYYRYAQLCGGRPTRLLGKGERNYVEFIFDTPDKYFISIVNRILGNITNYKTKIQEKNNNVYS